MASDVPLLQVTGLARSYQLPRRSLWRAPEQVHALRGVDFTLTAGRSLGVVGESGSGKSTLARLVMALDTPSAGSVRLLGQDLHKLDRQALRTDDAGCASRGSQTMCSTVMRGSSEP